jgi:predicted RNA-binding Zn ribbon-like protein
VHGAHKGRAFELVGGHPTLDLINTLDWRFRVGGQEELLGNYRDLLDFSEQAGLLTAKQARHLMRTTSGVAGRVLDQAREMREALSDLIYAHIEHEPPREASVPTLERFFHAAGAESRLVRDRAELKWDLAHAEARPEFPLWILARAASQLMFSENVDRVRSCHNLECRWLFLDTSKNHTRRWCDMKICGNRMKARRFRASRGSD